MTRPALLCRRLGQFSVAFSATAFFLWHTPPVDAQTEPGARVALTAGQTDASITSPLDAWRSPVLTNTRYDEHWDALADSTLRDEHWTGRFKYIPLADDAYLTTGTELRARDESYRGNGFGSAAAPDDGYLWLRALPYADLHVGSDRVGGRAFVQPMATYAIGVSPAATGIDQSRLDVLQAFGDVRIGPAATGSTNDYGVTLRYGRQMISLGSERLVGTRYGINVPLAYEGLRALVSTPHAIVNLLAVQPVTPGTSNFDDHATHGRSLWGAYATIPELLGPSVDLYYLNYENDAAAFAGVKGREKRQTVGVRLFAARSEGWHYDIEGMNQFGHFDDSRIAAWAAAFEVGHKLLTRRMSPDLTLRADVVSGDRRPGDRHLGTFDPLFPKGKYFGELTPIGPANIINLNPRLTIPVTPNLSLGIMAQGFWRYSLNDGIYGVPGNLVRAAGESRARFVGKQAEGIVSWQATSELALSASLSAFDPGAFIRQTGSSRTITLVGAEANYRF